MNTDRHLLAQETHDNVNGQMVATFRSSMLRRFGLVFRLLGLGRLLRPARLEKYSSEFIRQAAEKGPIIYVLYKRSVLDWYALNHALNTRRLPLAAFSTSPGFFVKPFFALHHIIEALRVLWQSAGVGKTRMEPRSAQEMAAAFSIGSNGCLFLRKNTREKPRSRKKNQPSHITMLIRAQGYTESPVQLVPVVIIWDRSPPTARSGMRRMVLGEEEWPGDLKKIRLRLTRHRDIIVQCGEPLDLKAFLKNGEGRSRQHLAQLLQSALRRILYREQAVVRGPRILSHRSMRRIVLSSPPLTDLLTQESRTTGKTRQRVKRELVTTFNRIAARISFTMMLLGDRITRFLWNRIYGGIDIRERDLQRVRSALRRGTPILTPSHRSHLDYVLISSVFYQHDIVIPHVVAGINLSFWPVGAIFRRLGAFFIKRSFASDRVFPVVFARYLHQIISEGYPLEFFLEGGRSRNGKLLPPKLGVLGMILDSAEELRRDDFDITFLPMNINYEQIAEEDSFTREIKGEQKKSESIGDMLRARRVLRHRYGRVYLRVGRPITSRDIHRDLTSPWSSLPPAERKDYLNLLGRRLLHRMNEQAVVLPTSLTATALLAHERRGIRRSTLLGRTRRLLAMLERLNVQISPILGQTEWAMDESLRRFAATRKIQLHTDGETAIYSLSEDHRTALEYYKNTILHFFVPASILALSIRRELHGSRGYPPSEARLDPLSLAATFSSLIHLFRLEFVLDPDASVHQLQAQAQEALELHGAIQLVERSEKVDAPDAASGSQSSSLLVANSQRLDEIASLLMNFVESYWLTLKSIPSLSKSSPSTQNLDKRATSLAIRKIGQALHAAEELHRAESLSLLNLRNALRVYTEDGIIRQSTEAPYRWQLHAQRYQQALGLLENLL